MSPLSSRALVAVAALAAASVAHSQPVNDSFAARINLGSANPANAAGTNVLATKEGGEPNHGGSPGGRSVWWSWTAPASGVTTVSTSGSNFDTLLGVYTGAAVGSLTFVAGNDDTPAAFVLGVPQKTSLATFNAASGTTYQIAVDGFFNATGSISLAISLAAGSAPPSLSISDTSLSEQDFGITAASFAVTLSSATTLPVNVSYTTGGGSATAGVDYVATSGTLHFSPGQAAAVVDVVVLGDAGVEGNDTFNVTLSAPTNALLADAVGVGTITNDDGVASTATDLAWQTGTVGASSYPGMPSINGIAFGAATYVAVGDYGDIWTSANLTAWTRRTNPDGGLRPLRGIAFGGGTLVAVGGCCTAFGGGDVAGGYTGGPILTSTNDGATWTYQTAVGERGLHAVAFGSGRFVAVGARGTVTSSTNGGLGWQFAAVAGVPDFMGVAFGGGAFVAVGEGGSIIRSTDGTTWAQGTVGTEDLRAVTYSGTQFVAVGASGTILTSPTGLSWTLQTSGTQASLSGVSASGSTIVAVGASVVLSSTNGIAWTPRSIPGLIGASTSQRAVGFGAEFVAAGDDGTLATSPDGVTWTNRTFVTSGVYRAVAFNGTATYCAVGNAGSVASSTNGVAWLLQAGIPGRPLWHWQSVASSGAAFVAVGDGAEIMSSPDCVNWTERNAGAVANPATGIAGHLSDVTFGGGLFVAVGEEMPNAGEGVVLVATSPSGTTWTQQAVSGLTADEHALTAVAQGSARFVTLGMNRATGRAVSVVSTDGGTTWNGQTIAAFGPYEEINDLAFGNGVFVAVGDRIWSSPDGIAWTLRRGYGAEPFRTVAFGGGRFMAGGDVGTLFGSEDGTFWAANLRATDKDLYGLTAGPGGTPDLLVGVGDSVTVSSGTPARPPNDNLANAIAVAGSAFTANGANAYGTKEPGEPSHAGGLGGRSVWWSWTAPQTGKAMVRTLGSGIDTLLAVYTGATMAALNIVGASDDFAGVTSRVRFDAALGTTYRFAVDGFGGAAGPLTISGGMAPLNDDFGERIDLPQFTTGTTGSNVNATYEPAEPFHAGNAGGRSVWWNWTAPASGTVTLTTAGSGLDSLLAVYTGNVSRPCNPPTVQPPNCLTQIAANDDQNPGVITTSLLSFPALAGTAYRIAVDGFNGASGSVTLGLTLTVPPPSLFVSDASVTEGHSGTKLETFTISLSGASNQTVTASYATSNGAASAGSDYVAVPPTLVTFAPGQVSQQVSVTLNGDTTIESDETFLVTLSNPVNATFTGGDPQGVGTIVNDDTQVSIADIFAVEPPTGSRDALFTVTVSPTLASSSVTVQFATANGTATSPDDYTAAAGTVTVPPNTPGQTLAVSVHADSSKEGPEAFTVTLSNPSAGAAIARAVGTARILDPGNFFTVNPCRLADTRGAEGPALTPGPDRTFAVAGRCGVPASARAASVNITVTQATDPGNLRLYPAGDALPVASAINYVPGQTRANNAVIPLGAGGQISVRLDQGAGSVHVILDVNGYIE